MEIHIQSDGQLYSPQKKSPAPAKPVPKEEPAPPIMPQEEENHWEDFLLLAIGFVLLRGKEGPDIPLLLALAYILFDSCFSLDKLL
ncbi:MAG: hypothetical protein IJN80_08245 [Clostridia bacterium]|nr:hypothetical protein [Clostridia bacterium]